MKMLLFVSLTAALAAPACSKDAAKAADSAGKAADSPAPAAAPSAADPAAAIPTDLPAPFAAWDLPARAKAWQGAWVSEQSLGFGVATEIKGAAVTTWDGKAEKHLTFQLESPCSAKLVEASSGGGTSSTTSHFTLRAGKLVEGLGDAGSRKGKTAIACVSDKILLLDESGTCTTWENDFGRWKSEPGTCGFAQKDGKEVFTAKIRDSAYELQIDGDALLSAQLAGHSSAPFPDFAAAKAARDKK